MTEFWIGAVALTVMALAFMIVPLMRKKTSEKSNRSEFDLTVYKDQLKEVERDQERGVLSEDQALAARTEIERRMLAAAQDQDSGLEIAETAHPKSNMMLLAAILVVVPLGAYAFYMSLGQPDLPDHPLASRVDEIRAAQSQQNINAQERQRARALLGQLEQRLKDNPENVEGWMAAANIYQSTGDYAKAVGAYEKLADLTNRHPQVLVAWVEALILNANSTVTPQTVEILKELKDKAPSDPRAYYYMALYHSGAGNLQAAMDEYVKLLEMSPSDAEWVAQVQERLNSVARDMGVDAPEVTMLPPANTGTGPATSTGPTREQLEQAQEMAPEEQDAMIKAMVQRLADKLKDNPDDLSGWQRLAQAYSVLGDQDGLAEAEANIERLRAGTSGN